MPRIEITSPEGKTVGAAVTTANLAVTQVAVSAATAAYSDSVPAYTGKTRSVAFTMSGSGAAFVRQSAADSNVGMIGVWINAAAAETANNQIIVLRNGTSTRIAETRFQANTGRIMLYRADGTVVWTSTATLPPTWVYLTMGVTIGSAAGRAMVRMYSANGALLEASPQLTGLNLGDLAINNYLWGRVTTGASYANNPLLLHQMNYDPATETPADPIAPAAPPNTAPTVTPAPDILDGEAGATLTTSVIASDGDGTIVSYTPTAPGLTLTGTGPSRTFPGPLSLTDQTYPVTWTVTDDDGASTDVTQNITVLAAPRRVHDGTTLVPAYIRTP